MELWIHRVVRGERLHVGWSLAKAAMNHAKHGVRFEDAFSVLDDDAAWLDQQVVGDESREKIVGRDASGRLLAPPPRSRRILLPAGRRVGGDGLHPRHQRPGSDPQ